MLATACESKHLETIKFLIQKGEDKHDPYVMSMARFYEVFHILEDIN